jgi:hypothetical protein
MDIVERINRLLTWPARSYKARKVTNATKGGRIVFRDTEIEQINLDDIDRVYKMIVRGLCGEIHYKELSSEEKTLLSSLLSEAKAGGLNYAQFNELLLLLNQDRLSEAFFEFFFGKEKITLEDLRQAIIKFRGYAMLCFGNFRFAYKQLIQKNDKELKEALEPYCRPTAQMKEEFKSRPAKALDIKKIDKAQTWYNGHIAKKKYEKEAALLSQLLSSPKDRKAYPLTEEELFSLSGIYEKIGESIAKIQQKSLQNTDIYLTWDYMDVYVATSMRHKWEFEETFEFIQKLGNHESLKGLNLRYFDPTQSQCKDRIDKGLIEGLMLKRALCSIYMAQEVDTMGKDSELAATLAQRKPVIAYVPSIDIDQHAEKIMRFPLDFFKLRFLILRAEGLFEDENCAREIEQVDSNFWKTIDDFLRQLTDYRRTQPFSLWDERENKFKEGCAVFPKICRILAIAEHHSYEKRADTLKDVHPLSIQVDLASGVANGVLVVRDHEECAILLQKILTNSMNFTTKHVGHKDEGMTILEDEISGCPFRVVTDYEKLTNSFWNFYLTSEK